MKKTCAIILAGCAVAAISARAADVDWNKLPPASTNAGVTFANDIQPLFKASCVGCHGGNRPRAQLRLDTLEGALKGTEKGPILAAGDSANSLVVKAVSQLDSETAMPPKPRGRGGRGGPGGPGGGQPPNFGGGPGADAVGTQGTNGAGMRGRGFGPPSKPLTAEQVGLIRAWIDQGAK